MKVDRRWLWFGGIVAGGAAALALGVPLGTLLVVAALLACPAMMYFGMRGKHHGSGEMASPPGDQKTHAMQPTSNASSTEALRPKER